MNQNKPITSYKVKIKNSRPDFRIFIDLLYGHGQNVDTDGNSFIVSSRSWTELYIKDRESNYPAVEIFPNENDPLIFEVHSASNKLMEVTALYLYLYCGESIYMEDKLLIIGEIEKMKEEHYERLSRAKSSIWHQSLTCS